MKIPLIAMACTNAGAKKTVEAMDFDGLKREAERRGCIWMRFEKREYVYADKAWHVIR
jgi:hypothetical protein